MKRVQFSKIGTPVLHAVLALLVLVLATSRYGLGISADSVEYLSMAENFSATGQLMNYRGEHLTVFPPLYTISVALLSGVLEAATAAHVLQLILFGALCFILSTGVRSITGSHSAVQRIAYHGLFAALLFSPVFAIARFAWAELMYIVICVLQFGAMKTLITRPTLARLAGASVLAAAAVMTRYIGVVNVGILLFAILFTMPAKPTRKIGYAATAVVLGGTGIALWMLRNYGIDQTILGPRFPSDIGLLENVARIVATLVSWIVPGALASQAYVATPLFVIAMVFFAWMLWANRDRVHWHALLLLASYIVLYTGWMAISATSYAFDAINTRLMAPVFLPLFFGAAHVMVTHLAHARRHRAAVRIVAQLAVMLVIAIHVPKDLVSPVTNGAGGYNSVVVQETRDLALSLLDMPEDARYASHPDLVYWISDGALVVREIPRHWEFNSPRAIVTTLDQLHGTWPNRVPAHLLICPGRVYQFSVAELSEIAEITPIVSDGIASLYLATARIAP